MKNIGYKHRRATSINRILISSSRILISSIVLLSTPFSYAQNSSNNLIKNPSFENNFGDWIDVEPSSISNHFRNGSKSAKVSNKPGSISQTVSVTQYTDYVFEGFIKGSGQIGVAVKKKKFRDQITGADDWVKARVEFNSGSATVIEVYANADKEQARFDDFSLTAKLEANNSQTKRSIPTSAPQCPSMGYLPIEYAFDDGNDGNVAANAIDGDPTSRWSSKGIGKMITFDLNRIAEVREIDVKWFKGHERVILFSVQTSIDGRNWSTVLSDASSTPSKNFEMYDIENIFNPEAKMIRIIGGGNSLHEWNSILELKIKGCVN